MIENKKRASFGTAPVYFMAISTILGAIMFLRFGYAVGNVGFLGVLFIILMGHLVALQYLLNKMLHKDRPCSGNVEQKNIMGHL